MSTSTRVSYGVLALTIILAGFLHLGPPLLVVLFSYFALRQLYYLTKRKWLALVLFLVVVTGIAAAAVHFTRAAIIALPDVAETSIPSASAWAVPASTSKAATTTSRARGAITALGATGVPRVALRARRIRSRAVAPPPPR